MAKHLEKDGTPDEWANEFVADLRKARINDEYSNQAKLEASRELRELEPTDPWYAVLGGPRTTSQLLRACGMGELYDGYYAAWSSNVHGLCRLPHGVDGDRRLGLRPLRDFADYDYAAVLSVLKALGDLVGGHVAH
jgi:hypothetical protein